MMGKKGWRFLGCFTLKQYAPRLEDVGYDGHVINMLRDAGENINWREVDGFEPDAPAITPSVEMPSLLESNHRGTTISGYCLLLAGRLTMTKMVV